ncbi:MAG: ATP-binding protein [Bacillota bacterium]
MIKRAIFQQITSQLFRGKVIVLYGARQVGKTTLLKQLVKETSPDDAFWLNGDEPDDRALLENATSTAIKRLIGNKKLVIIDEAQRVKNIGLTLKIAVDNFPELQFIASGSSSFDLANKISEPLTGRKREFLLFPLSFGELSLDGAMRIEKRLLEARLVFGSYPEVINSPGEERTVLRTLSDDYLYKDIFTLSDIRKPTVIADLLKALALQVGNQVSYGEISKLLGINSQTVERYVQLLEQSFILFRLRSYSRNLRNELSHSRKIYFYDNGILNAATAQFAPLGNRVDVGALWENYLMSERMKYLRYQNIWANSYFWRTTAQQEIDYIEEYDGRISAYEFKWSEKQRAKISSTFKKAYEPSITGVITRENYCDWLQDDSSAGCQT